MESPAAKAPRPSRVFISIPKKIVRHAVKRNRIRRVLREAFRGRDFGMGKTHVFKVTRFPESVDLAMAKKALNELSV